MLINSLTLHEEALPLPHLEKIVNTLIHE